MRWLLCGDDGSKKNKKTTSVFKKNVPREKFSITVLINSNNYRHYRLRLIRKTIESAPRNSVIVFAGMAWRPASAQSLGPSHLRLLRHHAFPSGFIRALLLTMVLVFIVCNVCSDLGFSDAWLVATVYLASHRSPWPRNTVHTQRSSNQVFLWHFNGSNPHSIFPPGF